ncbi:MAG: hypothetical protein KKE30_00995 [Gammaproteobacteria bacterium]|nr:hypothetical protein [Gammaproteobacteria bacterium]MBU1556993.1 hypothetical protein [Gammaproteobacteria bacterium]MBU2071123.1 hypothetical protein [Gammaproteobacteria bacterium]MBU2183058.1 hypothetical protein [Gammaproteobacteria bacterium]MBU2203182.1 hypothetical protein [Gammaproteobacteria bacterium]
MAKLSVALLLLWVAPVAADSSGCIQAPKRQKACPNLIYRVAQLPAMPAPAMVCICASDFAPLLVTPASDSEKVQQNMLRRQMEVVHGEKLQSVLDILQRRL